MDTKRKSPMVVAVGGCGTNCLATIRDMVDHRVKMVMASTDSQALDQFILGFNPTRFRLGKLGPGGTFADPEIGRQAAVESATEFSSMLETTSIAVFIVGLGGGTGSGATPVLAELSVQAEIPTAVFCTTPFKFEGKRRLAVAVEAENALRRLPITVVCFPNNRLMDSGLVTKETTMRELFATGEKLIGGKLCAYLERWKLWQMEE